MENITLFRYDLRDEGDFGRERENLFVLEREESL